MSSVQSFEDEHEAFSASRVSQYVYVPAKDSYYTQLDQHADTLEGDVKPPLVLLGSEGSGKSALLANWVAKRRLVKHREEFLFQHFVGCSTPSLQIAHTLFRLETALKEFFQLREMKIPETEEELRWGLNRFLEAAAKKHSPARIIIIIDGINRLRSEGGVPDGALHWLPTELPPCVRFILSTVEFERSKSGTTGAPQNHRSYVELLRRKCPTLKMEPLGVLTRQSVISTFISLNQGSIEFSESHKHKIITANVTSQPMYLRALLQALRVTSRLTSFSIDQMLELFLSCQSAAELISKNLNVCCDAIFGSANNEENNNEREILGKIFTVVYVSRNGLTCDEIWGLITLVTRIKLDEKPKNKVLSVLTEFTMVVNDMHSFSHEVYRELVFDMFIQSNDSLTRWHHFVARYFDLLPPCPRKLVALPYHLECARSWSKVKNCLTDIEMFTLWWSPPFKADFIKFWVSLTRVIPKENRTHRKGDSSSDSGGGAGAMANKPSYDIVEEYVKSLDEYRTLKHPSDEKVASIILKISDFLLEFATLGHEKAADVPCLIHPQIPPSDLEFIGVPHIITDEEGRSILNFPALFNRELSASIGQLSGDDGSGPSLDNAPTKAADDLPVCTTYFFNRWMWIQFPYIAVGNCDKRYVRGKEMSIEAAADLGAKGKTRSNVTTEDALLRTSTADTANRKPDPAISGRPDPPKLWSLTSSGPLPAVKFVRKAPRSLRKTTHLDLQDEALVNSDKVAQRLNLLQDDIQAYRDEFDYMCQMKLQLNRKLFEMKGELEDLKRSELSCEEVDSELQKWLKKESDAAQLAASVQILRKNLGDLVIMCDRHPAKASALITDVELKIEQDKFILEEIKRRLWEQKFEKQTHVVKFRETKKLLKEGAAMYNAMIEYRLEMKMNLGLQYSEETRRLNMSKSNDQLYQRMKSNQKLLKSGAKSDHLAEEEQLLLTQTQQNWQDTWAVISARTGITEPEIFFQRLNNGSGLEEQINTLKKASESRVEFLKNEFSTVEAELEKVRYEASFAGVESSQEKKKELADRQSQLRHIKERSESAQQLVQNVTSGLLHIADSLGISPPAEVDRVGDLLRDIEALVESLKEEREKLQQQTQQHHSAQSAAGPDSVVRGAHRDELLNADSGHAHRSPELEALLLKYEKPKSRCPEKLPSRPLESDPAGTGRERLLAEEEDGEDEGTWDRTFVKTQSFKSLRTEMKKAASKKGKQSTDELNSTV